MKAWVETVWVCQTIMYNRGSNCDTSLKEVTRPGETPPKKNKQERQNYSKKDKLRY